MRIAGYEMRSVVDGPGIRNVVFFQGCKHNCAGCHNPETHDMSGGIETTVYEVFRKLYDGGTKGATLSGGDPFFQREELAQLAQLLRHAFPSVWVYTGFLFEQLVDTEKDILKNIDVLVDGRFELVKRSVEVPFVGSANQRLVDVQKTLKTGEVVLWEKCVPQTEFDDEIVKFNPFTGGWDGQGISYLGEKEAR